MGYQNIEIINKIKKHFNVNFVDDKIIIGDLIVFKDKIISPIDTKFQYVLDSLKPYLINNNYNKIEHKTITNKNFMLKDNKIYFNKNLICEFNDYYIIHYKFEEEFFLKNESIIKLIKGECLTLKSENNVSYVSIDL